MILLLAALVVAAVLAARFLAVPRTVALAAARDVVPAVRQGNPYAYQYVLKGAGGRDVGDHDADKFVVRADRVAGRFILVRVAPVDRAGRRTGRSRVLKLTLTR